MLHTTRSLVRRLPRMYSAATSRGLPRSTAKVTTAPPAPPPSSSSSQPRWSTPHPLQSKPHRHRPATSTEEENVYVLTLRLSPSLHDPLNALRSKHFPRDRLKVPAHLTLFHALPQSKLDDVVLPTLSAVAGRTRPFKVTTGGVFLLGKNGVAVSPGEGTDEGAKVHAQLREEWSAFLSKQDSKGFKAHWTVQNKVEDEKKVQATFREVREWAKETGAEGEADGLVLWRYDRGRWVFEKEFAFEG